MHDLVTNEDYIVTKRVKEELFVKEKWKNCHSSKKLDQVGWKRYTKELKRIDSDDQLSVIIETDQEEDKPKFSGC